LKIISMGTQVTFSEQRVIRSTTNKVRFILEKARPFVCVLLYLSLPNLLLILFAGALSGLPHGYINMECLAIGAAGMFLPRGVVFAALLTESVVDFAYGVCYTYRFSPSELFSSLRYLPSIPETRLLEGLALLASSVLICWLLARARPHPRSRMRTACALLACAVIATAIDLVDGQNLLWRKDSTLTSYRLVRSPALVLSLWEVSAIRMGAPSPGDNGHPMASASAEAIAFLDHRAGAAESPNVVLIVVESWGLPRDAHLAQALVASYDDPRITARYRLTSGTAPFTGLTVPGEARELCHSTIGFGILHVSPALAGHCLPSLFHSRGYQDLAIHGFVGQMFYRNSWYRELGFDRSWFGPELHLLGLPDCPGAFPGTCDTAIAKWIGDTLLAEGQDKPRLIYWVTLNSHLPEPAHPDLPDDGVCASEPALRNSTALCSWFRLVQAVHQSVQRTALASAGRPTVFVLVGDHAPQFSDPDLRAEFSSIEVPYVMLTPVEVSAH
jgi:hypothetical protein